MKRPIVWRAMLLFAGVAPVAIAQHTGRPLKLLLDRQSNVDQVAILKHLGQKCPNITLTTNVEQSDYMLSAWGWSGSYRFMISAKGGEKIFGTQTVYLSNAVKDVCHFLNTRPQPHTQPQDRPQYQNESYQNESNKAFSTVATESALTSHPATLIESRQFCTNLFTSPVRLCRFRASS
jgi:hypothetical protein